MSNFNEIKNILNRLPTNKGGVYGKRALNMLEKEGLAYIDYASGSASALHDAGNYLRVCGFLNSGRDFARPEDAHRVVGFIIEHLQARGEKLFSH